MRTVTVGLLLAASIVAQDSPGRGVPDWVEAGPMIGHVGPTEARIWVKVTKGVKLQARATFDGVHPRIGRIKSLGDRIRLVLFDGLQGDKDLLVQLYRGEHPTRGVAVFIRTAPPPSVHGKVRIAFGSCLNDVLYESFPVFSAVVQERPDLFLFLGDNTYYVKTWKDADGKRRIRTSGEEGDWTSEKKMFTRQMRTRRNPWMQTMLGSVPCYAIWDDHDYGPNNGDRLFAGKKKSLKVFKRMWANPRYGVKGTKGCFSSFRRGPVEVFLMDCRYHKYVKTPAHPDVPLAECRIWGDQQLDWLCKGLRASDAPIKLVANGTQVLYHGKTGEGHHQEARAEYRRLLDYLHQHRIGGVVFLTGDRHHSELMHLKAAGRPTLIDFTSSPLGQDQRVATQRGEQQPTTVWKMNGDSYGLVTVDIDADGGGTIQFEARDVTNRVPVLHGLGCKTSWKLSELQYPKRAGKPGRGK